MISCVEKYSPELKNNNDHFLVVDGQINNYPGPYTVKLSYSSSVLDTLFIPKSSAILTILDNQGNKEILTEESPGIYKTSPNGIQGIIGHSYKINIWVENGNIYESEYEELLNPANIESLYYENEWRYAQNELETNQEGFQFYIDYLPTDLTKDHFFWEIEETYEYHSSFRIYLMLDGKGNNNTFFEGIPIKELSNVDTLYYCWKTQILNELLSYALKPKNTTDTKSLPLHFVPIDDIRLRWGYNISIKQFSISKQAHDFLESLKKQSSNQSNLFNTQPFQIRGNVNNIQNTTEPVLGYFLVASGTTVPRFQTRAHGGLYYERQICYYDSTVSGIIHRIENTREEDLPLFLSYFHFDLDGDPLLGPVLIETYYAPPCIDCRRRGGQIIKPKFWE